MMRRILAIIGIIALATLPANAGGVLSVLIATTANAFIPVTHTFNSGSGNETVPMYASKVVITVDGAGGGGSCANDGGNGGQAVKTIILVGGDWGAHLAYSVGAGGSGGSTGGGGTNGDPSTSSGTLAAGSYSMTGNGGGHGKVLGPGDPGTATGGDTNTTGGGQPGGAGGFDCATPVPGNGGHDGRISFAYT